MNKSKPHLHIFLNLLNLLYICIRLYLQYILNLVFTIVFYAMRQTKQDLNYIYFKDLLYIYICLYLQQIKSYEHELRA
jgi:hypothetical protein